MISSLSNQERQTSEEEKKAPWDSLSSPAALAEEIEEGKRKRGESAEEEKFELTQIFKPTKLLFTQGGEEDFNNEAYAEEDKEEEKGVEEEKHSSRSILEFLESEDKMRNKYSKKHLKSITSKAGYSIHSSTKRKSLSDTKPSKKRESIEEISTQIPPLKPKTPSPSLHLTQPTQPHIQKHKPKNKTKPQSSKPQSKPHSPQIRTPSPLALPNPQKKPQKDTKKSQIKTSDKTNNRKRRDPPAAEIPVKALKLYSEAALLEDEGEEEGKSHRYLNSLFDFGGEKDLKAQYAVKKSDRAFMLENKLVKYKGIQVVYSHAREMVGRDGVSEIILSPKHGESYKKVGPREYKVYRVDFKAMELAKKEINAKKRNDLKNGVSVVKDDHDDTEIGRLFCFLF